jgi:YbgC/YbaW family acyl-CoA thioester hydrolase
MQPIDQFAILRRVEFSDTDMAGIVHFSAYCRYMESAEHALFRSLGHSIVTEIDGRLYGWPRVHMECDWMAPLRFEDEFEIRLFVREVRSKALVFDFVFTRTSGTQPQRVATGSLTTVCVTHDGSGAMRAAAIPTQIADRLRPASKQTLEKARS